MDEGVIDPDTPLGMVSPKLEQKLRDIGCTCSVNALVHSPDCPVKVKR